MQPVNLSSNRANALPFSPSRPKAKTRWLPFLGIAGLLIGTIAGLGSCLTTSHLSLQNRVNVLANTPSWNTTLPQLSNLLSLQKQADSLGWIEPLSVTPPLPQRSYPIKREQAENWISAHSGPEEQHAARALVEATRHVPHGEFEGALSRSISQFNDWLEQEEDKNYVLVVTSKEKSNRWVAQLGLKYFKILPKQVLQVPAVCKLPKEFIQFTKNNPLLKTFVFMDDAAYGCSQSKWQLAELSSIDLYQECGHHLNSCSDEKQMEIRKQEKAYRIKAIIPFMRTPDCVLPSSDVQYSHSYPPLTDRHIQVFSAEKILTMKEALSSENRVVLQELYYHFKDEHAPIYFDHKLADSASTCTKLYEGDLNRYPCRHRLEDWNLEDWNLYEERLRKENTWWNRLTSWIKGPPDTRFIDPIQPPYK